MELLPVSDAGRLIVWVLVGIATAINVFLGNVYEENIGYQFRRLAKRQALEPAPEPVPWGFKLLSVVFLAVMVVGTAYASSAPPLETSDSEVDALVVIQQLLERTEGDSEQQGPTNILEEPTEEVAETPAVEPTATEIVVDPGDVPLTVLGQWNWRGNTPTEDPDSNPDLDNFPSIVAFSATDEEGAAHFAASFPDGYMALFEIGANFEAAPIGEFVGDSYIHRAKDILFLPNENTLISGTVDGKLHAYGFSSSGISVVPLATYEVDAEINDLAYSTDWEVVAAGLGHSATAADSDDSQIYFIDPTPGNFDLGMPLMNTNQKSIYDLAFTIDGDLISVGNYTYILTFTHAENPSRMLYEEDITVRAINHKALAVSPNDANLFYTSHVDSRIALFNIDNEVNNLGPPVVATSQLLEGDIESIVYHPTLDVLAVGTSDCLVYLIDANSLALIATSEELCGDFNFNANKDIGSLAFAPDGSYLVAGHSYGFAILNIPVEILSE